MSATPEPIPDNETPNQRQARLRRDRRNAKIQAGGSARLAAITDLSGRPPPAPEDAPAPAPSAPQPQRALQPSATDDPDEVDISQHHYTPRSTSRPLTPSQAFPGLGSGCASPFPGGPNASARDDPQLRMLQQLLGGLDPNAGGAGGGGGGGGGGSSGDPAQGLPPGLAQMMAAMNSGGGMGGQQPAPSSAYIWRIVHAVLALGLAAYIAGITAFTGAKAARERGVDLFGDEEAGAELRNVGQRLFRMFATAEVVLQSSRFFLERGTVPPSGILGMLVGVLPEPFAGYVRVLGRYSVIYTTVVADAMVVVFVLGCVAWWRGAVA